MLARILLPIALLSLLLGGCGSFSAEHGLAALGLVPARPATTAVSADASAAGFGETTIVAEVALPIVSVDGTAVAGWFGHVVRDEADDIWVAGERAPYRLDTGDKLRIFVYAQPSLSRIYTVDAEGFISVPLIGNVRARGTTTRALEKDITARLGTEFVRDPQVTVDIQQNRPFFILGEVRAAGQYPYVAGLSVDAAVAIAGGYSERADERKVHITRRIRSGLEKLTVAGDAEVRPGDTIYVKERWF